MPLPNPDIDNLQLLRRLREGDREAFDQIYLFYRRGLYESAYKRLGDSAQAEDLVQDVFFSLWDKRESRQIEDLPAYLHTAIRYKVFSFVSRHKEVRFFLEPIQWLTEGEGPDDQLIKKELLATIHAYAGTLPKKRKQIFLLYMNSHLSTSQIATELNVSVKTVQNQLGSAIDSLYELVSPAAGLGLFAAIVKFLDR